jgi:hypothetical protein
VDTTLKRIRNLVPSRERIEELRRIARGLEQDAEVRRVDRDWRGGTGGDRRAAAKIQGTLADAELLDGFADLLLDIRQAVWGGRKEVRGSRHWTDIET